MYAQRASEATLAASAETKTEPVRVLAPVSRRPQLYHWYCPQKQKQSEKRTQTHRRRRVLWCLFRLRDILTASAAVVTTAGIRSADFVVPVATAAAAAAADIGAAGEYSAASAAVL